MRSIIVPALSLLAAYGWTAPTSTNTTQFPDYLANTKGFRNVSTQPSVGGQAICISGTIDVTASAQNVKLDLAQPANQTELTNIVLEVAQINSTFIESIEGGLQDVSGTYGIYSQLCVPAGASTINATTIQFLIHGGGFDRLYWNNAPGYSYVDFAAEQGYATFLYDRLGTGLSDHPDPMQVTQFSLDVALAHELIQSLRSGSISAQAFEHVVAVGHSYGRAQTLGITIQHPIDLNAVVLTGAAAQQPGMLYNFVGQVQTIASQNDPSRFSNLPNGYALPGSIEGIQWGFFRAPQFDPVMLDLANATKQPQGLGELLYGLGPIKPAVEFTGSVYVVTGENDLPVCDGNCLLPENMKSIAAVKDVVYPAASNGSGSYIVPGTGHGINFHYTAGDAYAHIHAWLEANGL